MTEETYLERLDRQNKQYEIVINFPDQEALPKKPWQIDLKADETGYYIGEGVGAPSGEEYDRWLNDCIEFIQMRQSVPIVIDRLPESERIY